MITITNREELAAYIAENEIDISVEANEDGAHLYGATTLEFPFTSEDVEEVIEETQSEYLIDEFDSEIYEDLTY